MPGCLGAQEGQAGVKDTTRNCLLPCSQEMALVGVSVCLCVLEEGSALEQSVDLCWRKEGGGVSEYLGEEGMSDGGKRV